MIPVDTTIVILIVVLVVVGLTGLLVPRGFHAAARFPFFFMPQTPYDEAAERRARIWGAIALVGAVITALLTEW